MIYEEDGDEVVAVGYECPNCGSEHTEYNRFFEYWKCEICSTVFPETSINEAEPASNDWMIDDGCALHPDDPEHDYVRYISQLDML